MAETETISIVDYEARWLDELIPMWRDSFNGALGIEDSNPVDDGQRRHFLEEVLPNHAVRLALQGDRLVGFLASSSESIDQLYVRVGCQRCGIGSALLALAKAESTGSLWLYTFAKNAGARAFYEHHGFSAVAFGFEEFWQLEDVQYRWEA